MNPDAAEREIARLEAQLTEFADAAEEMGEKWEELGEKWKAARQAVKTIFGLFDETELGGCPCCDWTGDDDG